MTQKPKNMSERARHTVERAAYVAVGAPTAALKAINARVTDLRETVRSSRQDIGDDLAQEFDQWVAQGEDVVARAMELLRRSDVAEEIKATARSTGQAARVGIEKATGAARSGLNVVAPDEELTAITGVGPGYADKLARVGIVGISRFLERTATDEETETLAKSAEISVETLRSWRAQVDLGRIQGVGDSYSDLLHRIGIWTLDDLAAASPAETAAEMRSLEVPDKPDQMPTETVIRQWKTKAKKIAASG